MNEIWPDKYGRSYGRDGHYINEVPKYEDMPEEVIAAEKAAFEKTDGHFSLDFLTNEPGYVNEEVDWSDFIPDPAQQAPDLIEQPYHYSRLAIQPRDFSMRNNLPVHAGDAIKYIVRAGHKLYPEMDSVESEKKDLEKAIDWLQARINLLNGEIVL